jgi:hypothetical protein
MNPEEILEQAFIRFLNNVMGDVIDKPLLELQSWRSALLNVADLYQSQIDSLE